MPTSLGCSIPLRSPKSNRARFRCDVGVSNAICGSRTCDMCCPLILQRDGFLGAMVVIVVMVGTCASRRRQNPVCFGIHTAVRCTVGIVRLAGACERRIRVPLNSEAANSTGAQCAVPAVQLGLQHHTNDIAAVAITVQPVQLAEPGQAGACLRVHSQYPSVVLCGWHACVLGPPPVYPEGHTPYHSCMQAIVTAHKTLHGTGGRKVPSYSSCPMQRSKRG